MCAVGGGSRKDLRLRGLEEVLKRALERDAGDSICHSYVRGISVGG